MSRYKIEFTSPGIDEARFRDALKELFVVHGVRIVRRSDETAVTHGSLEQLALLELLSDGKPWRRKALLDQMEKTCARPVAYRAIMKLVSSGLIQKVRNGVFVHSGVPLEDHSIPPLHPERLPLSAERLINLLQEPRSGPFLKEALGVTRQRVEQLLKRLIQSKRIKRFEATGERGHYVYVAAERASRELISNRSPNFTDSRERVLSALPHETIVRHADVAVLTGCQPAVVRKHCDDLAARGFVISFKMGKRQYVSITPRGLRHPQYDREAPKANSADVVSDFGEARIRYLEHIAELEPVRTIDVTYSMPSSLANVAELRSGQMMQRLETSGLVAEASGSANGHPRYTLTDYGRFVVNVVRRVRARPDAAGLRRAIDERNEKKQAAMRQRAILGVEGACSPTQAAIVKTLVRHGPMSAIDIASTMDIKFRNPRSANLALRTLAGRSLVKKAGTGRNGATIWSLAGPKTEDAMNSPVAD